MTLPAHPQAEEALIGAMLLSSDAINNAVANVSADEFVGDRTRQMFEVIVMLWLAGEQVDVLTVTSELVRIGAQITQADIAKYTSLTPDVHAAAKYAQIVSEHATMRRLMFLGDDLRAKAEAMPDDPYELAQQAIGWLGDIASPVEQIEPGPDIDSFLEQVDPEAEMIVPDFLERTDRIVLTGGEGQGKVRPSAKEGSRWHPGSCLTHTPFRVRHAECCSSTARTRQASCDDNWPLCGRKQAIGSTRRGSSWYRMTADLTCSAATIVAGLSPSSSRIVPTW